jgi:hypothetical protein
MVLAGIIRQQSHGGLLARRVIPVGILFPLVLGFLVARELGRREAERQEMISVLQDSEMRLRTLFEQSETES